MIPLPVKSIKITYSQTPPTRQLQEPKEVEYTQGKARKVKKKIGQKNADANMGPSLCVLEYIFGVIELLRFIDQHSPLSRLKMFDSRKINSSIGSARVPSHSHSALPPILCKSPTRIVSRTQVPAPAFAFSDCSISAPSPPAPTLHIAPSSSHSHRSSLSRCSQSKNQSVPAQPP